MANPQIPRSCVRQHRRKKIVLCSAEPSFLKRDLRTSASIRAVALLRRNEPVPGILAARRPGALMHKSGPRPLRNPNPHCQRCFEHFVNDVLIKTVNDVLTTHRSLAPPRYGLAYKSILCDLCTAIKAFRSFLRRFLSSHLGELVYVAVARGKQSGEDSLTGFCKLVAMSARDFLQDSMSS
jgi:hypothetical protein